MKPHTYCRSILTKVSRTFAINIAILRGHLYKSILCAYLFCRIADTVEDTPFDDVDEQQHLLARYRDLFIHRAFNADAIERWVADFESARKNEMANSAELDLVHHTRLVVENYQTLPAPYRKAIDKCIVEMTAGMQETIAKKQARTGSLYFSETISDLNRYCYFVAGTVGILLTRLFFVHSRSITRSLLRTLRSRAVSFGLGLQLTNIIKDCHTDYSRGWCYIPRELTQKNGLAPQELFEPANQSKAQKTLNDLIARAAAHLDDALDYSLQIPRRNVRIRLFCLLPLFFAIATLVEAKDNFTLLAGEKVKISRERVKQLIRNITMLCLSNQALKSYYSRFRMQLQDI